MKQLALSKEEKRKKTVELIVDHLNSLKGWVPEAYLWDKIDESPGLASGSMKCLGQFLRRFVIDKTFEVERETLNFYGELSNKTIEDRVITEITGDNGRVLAFEGKISPESSEKPT